MKRDMRKTWFVSAVLLLLCASGAWSVDADEGSAACPEPASAPPLGRIDIVIDSALARGELAGARVGVLVEALETGEVLYERNADKPFIPASNMKVVTAAAALELLGPDYVYKTIVATKAGIEDGRLDGDLYIRGSGDPSLVFEEMERLAEALRFRGLELIDGDVVLDDGLFAVAGPVDPDAHEGDRAYHARVGALSYNFNAVAVRVAPSGGRGDRALVSLSPETGFVDITNRAVTASAGSRSTIVVRRRRVDGRNIIEVEGRVPAGSPGRAFYRSLDDPTGWFGSGLTAALDRAGIEVTGRARRGATPGDAVELVTHESKPLALLARDLGKFSNNFIAEQVLLTIAAEAGEVPATTEAGARSVSDYLGGVVPDTMVADLRVVDGSGFSRTNRLTPRAIVSVMRSVLTSFETSYEFGGSLSVSGRDGTLSDRMGYPDLEGAVRAKTGLLDGVTAISGVTVTNAGEEVLFSILVNGFGCEAWRSHDLEHAVLGAIREGR